MRGWLVAVCHCCRTCMTSRTLKGLGKIMANLAKDCGPSETCYESSLILTCVGLINKAQVPQWHILWPHSLLPLCHIIATHAVLLAVCLQFFSFLLYIITTCAWVCESPLDNKHISESDFPVWFVELQHVKNLVILPQRSKTLVKRLISEATALEDAASYEWDNAFPCGQTLCQLGLHLTNFWPVFWRNSATLLIKYLLRRTKPMQN